MAPATLWLRSSIPDTANGTTTTTPTWEATRGSAAPEEATATKVSDWGRDFDVDSFLSFNYVHKTMLEINKITFDDFSNAHKIDVKLGHEPPSLFKKNPHPYPLGRRVSDTNSRVKDRCFTPYNVIVYSTKPKFPTESDVNAPSLAVLLFKTELQAINKIFFLQELRK